MRLPAWLIAFALAVSSFAPPVAAQESRVAPEEDRFAALHSPSAFERETAQARLKDEELLAHYRALLNDGGNAAQVISGLERVGARKDTADIPLIVKYIGALDPGVAEAAMGALRSFGSDALKAVKDLDAGEVDAATRKDAIERLLKDHIQTCCRRDLAINPFHLEYDGRLDELYSVGDEINELMFRLLRDSIGDIRDDISGNRYYYWNGQAVYESPFVDYGGLAVYALGRRDPERLMKEVGELAEVQPSNDFWGWSYASRTPVTIELATFFARRGDTALIDKVISDLEGGNRWRQGNESLGLQVMIAGIQMVALGEDEAALERLNENVKQAGSALSSTVSQAHYLRARILMKLKEQGAALHALEESMEASDAAMVLTLVDGTFAPLQSERRFQAVLDYCRLAARRLNAAQRPWGFTE
ncbi:MAG: hypothetical protein K8I27_09790 [Planctomycetes bacterium]|nr:hypothetical protein [Planctomycetota bacterium]